MERSNPDFSVIICTRNRAQQLSVVLASLCAMDRPSDAQWELVVVDNGSTDETPAIIAAFGERLPIRSVSQPVPGLSNARNAGVQAAQGSYILWTDDDVKVTSKWLTSYAAAFQQHPEAAVFGGKITPVPEKPVSPWFAKVTEYIPDLLAVRDFGPTPAPLSSQDDRLPFGANYAIRAAEQKAHPYDPQLGVAPGRRRGGEETQVIEDILNAGATGWWVPGSEVLHLIPLNRQSPHYVRQYYEALGEKFAFLLARERASFSPLPQILLASIKFTIAAPLAFAARIAPPALHICLIKIFAGNLGKARYFASTLNRAPMKHH